MKIQLRVPFLPLLFLGLYSFCSAQSIVGKVYVSYSDQITVFGLDRNGVLDSNHAFTARKGTKFSVVGFDEKNNVLITFWRYYVPRRDSVYVADTFTKAAVQSYPDQLAFISKWANYRKFAINPKTLNATCREFFAASREFTWGVMTLPIKVRFGNGKGREFDFEERLNLGFVFGSKKQLKGYTPKSLNTLAGFGITSAKTDSNMIKDLSKYDGKTALALTLHAGWLYQVDNFQVGLFVGADFIPGKIGRVWYHQGRPWIGLAIGVSLFSKNSTGTDDKKNTNSTGSDD